ncbi:MAG: hypothetical protein ACRDP9_05215 [Kribbellaceae bacterium]
MTSTATAERFELHVRDHDIEDLQGGGSGCHVGKVLAPVVRCDPIAGSPHN